MIYIVAGVALILVGVLVALPLWAMVACIVVGCLVLLSGVHTGGYLRR